MMYAGYACLIFAVALGLVSFLISLPGLKKQQAEQEKIQQQKSQQ